MLMMKDSGKTYLGVVPASWDIKKVKYVASEYNENGIMNPDNDHYIGLENLVSYSNNLVETETEYIQSVQKVCKKNSVLFGKLRPYLAKAIISPVDGYCTSEFLELLGYKVDTNFLRYALLNPNVVDEINMSTYGAKMPRANSEFILNISICYPPLPEQQAIADYLDTKCAEIDALSADIQAQIDTLEEYKRSVITEAVTKGLNKDVEMQDSGTEWLGDIPAKWGVSRIGAIYTLRMAKVSDRDYQPLSVTMNGVVPQLETAAKTNAHDDRKLVRKGDFAINSRSDRRGSCGISPMDGSVSLINTILAPKKAMNPEYYNWLFHTPAFADEFYKWGHGIVDDLWTTGWQDMKKILIPYPPMQEQEQIAAYLNDRVDDINAVIDIKHEQLATLDEYKKSLIYEYVTGKKSVSEVS